MYVWNYLISIWDQSNILDLTESLYSLDTHLFASFNLFDRNYHIKMTENDAGFSRTAQEPPNLS